MINRYVKEMGVDGYDQILKLTPAHTSLRWVVAYEIGNILSKKKSLPHTIYDLGCGRGDSIWPVMKLLPHLNYVLVDESQEMLERVQYMGALHNVYFVKSDILKFLRSSEEIQWPSVVTSSWTIHNFDDDFRKNVLRAVADKIHRGKTQSFVWMDKIYPDVSDEEMQRMLDRQKDLYKYLPDELEDKMCKHEDADFKIRMIEKSTLDFIRNKLGLKVEVKARVERDVVLVIGR